MTVGQPLAAGALVEPAPGAFVLAQRRDAAPAVVLGPRETALLAEMPWPLRRAEWLAGRQVAKAVLQQALGLEPARVDVVPRPSGAPTVLVDGLERTDLVLTLTHTRAWAAAAVAKGPIGVDVCDVVDGHRLERIGRRVFSEGEAEGCGAHRSPERQAAVWALKEAVLKLRIGGVFDPGAKSVRVVSLEPAAVGDGTRVALYRLGDAMLAVAT